MVQFQRATGKNPDEFLEWTRTVEPVEVQDLIDRVADSIQFPGARFNFKVEMRSFLRTNGYNNLPKSNLSYTLAEWHRGYRKEEIRKLLGFLDDSLQKFYVYVCVETGLRAQTVLNLRYKHVKEDLQADPGITQGVVAVRFGPEFFNRKKSSGFTFLGRRSVALLRELIKEGRVREKDESPLVDKEYMTIWKVLNKARDKAGIDKKVQLSHGFRKYFEQGLDLARPPLDEDRKRMIEGHFEGTRGKHYTGREWDDLRPDYVRAYPQIDLDTGDPELEAKLQTWPTEKAEMQRQIDELREFKRKTVDQVWEEMQPRLDVLMKKRLDRAEQLEIETSSPLFQELVSAAKKANLSLEEVASYIMKGAIEEHRAKGKPLNRKPSRKGK